MKSLLALVLLLSLAAVSFSSATTAPSQCAPLDALDFIKSGFALVDHPFVGSRRDPVAGQVGPHLGAAHLLHLEAGRQG